MHNCMDGDKIPVNPQKPPKRVSPINGCAPPDWPSGRPKGLQNKVTLDFKQAVVKMLEFAAPQMVEWLGQIAKDDPARALAVVDKIADYAFPRQNRTEHVGDGGGPVQTVTEININLIRAKPHDGA